MELSSISGRRTILFAGLLLAAVALIVLRQFDPATSGIFPPCPFYALTGWYCPGCGSLRALHQLLHGNLRQAFAFNPFTVLALPFVVYGILSFGLFELGGRGLPRVFLPGWTIRALAATVILFAVLRNLPMFSLLAP